MRREKGRDTDTKHDWTLEEDNAAGFRGMKRCEKKNWGQLRKEGKNGKTTENKRKLIVSKKKP